MPRHHPRQRGTVYLLVLSVTAMLVAIGVTAVMVGRVDLRSERLEAEQQQARTLAINAIEVVRLQLEQSANWRATHTHETWSAVARVGNNKYRYKLSDPADGDLKDDDTDPFVLTIEATAGDAVRIYSITVRDGKVYESTFPVVRSADDAGESTLLGTSVTGAGTVTLGTDGLYTGMGGVRFDNLPVQPGHRVLTASIQFTADATDNGATNVIIWAHAHDDAPSFTGILWEVSGRSKTAATATWQPDPWVAGASGSAQATPDLAELVQEIVDRPGWKSGNAVAFILEADKARVFRTRDHSAAAAPVLHLTYTAPGLTPDYTTLRRELAE